MSGIEYPARIFHIARSDEWQQALEDGAYRTGSLDTEGFIHFSTGKQLLRTADKFFHGNRDVVLLIIDPARLAAELRYEPVGEQFFPHLYGILNLDAVSRVIPFTPRPDGTFAWPETLQRNEGEL